MDTKMLSGLRILLLGVVTFGCDMARTLLGWGLINRTFFDSGRYSLINLVQHGFFHIDDCREGGRFKVKADAEAPGPTLVQTLGQRASS